MNARTKSFFALVALACGGCASDGLSPREENNHSLANNVYQAPDLTDATALAPGATLAVAAPKPINEPIRVGVVQVGEVAPPESMLEKFRSRKDLFSLVMPLPGNLEQAGPGMPKLRNTAAGLGLNYLLVYGGNVDKGRTPTPLRVFDVTIIGAWIIPSDEIWANGKAAGSLIDVSTGKIALNLSVDARDTLFLPTATANDADDALTSGMRDHLVQKMTDQTIARLSDGRAEVAMAKTVKK